MISRCYLPAAWLAAIIGASAAATAQAADPGARWHRIERYAKSGVSATIAACLVDAEDRARAEGKLGAIEWTAPDRAASVSTTAKPATRRAPDTRVEVDGVGRDEATGGWTPLKARCAYREGRLTTVAIESLPPPSTQPPSLDLGLKPPVDATTGSESAALAGAPSGGESSASSRTGNGGGSASSLRPTLRRLPVDTPIREPQNFLSDHRFGVELKSRF
jgi:hypothetical protein